MNTRSAIRLYAIIALTAITALIAQFTIESKEVTMDYVILHDELTTDPLTRGYSTMTDAEAAADLNSTYRTHTLQRLDQADVYNTIVPSEFIALTEAERQEIWDIIHVGGSAGLWVRSGDTARARFIAIFGAQSDTIQALLVLITQDITRAQELGLGTVKPGHVAKARAL